MLSVAQFWARASGVFDPRSAPTAAGPGGCRRDAVDHGSRAHTPDPGAGDRREQFLDPGSSRLGYVHALHDPLERLHRAKAAAGSAAAPACSQARARSSGVSLLKDIRAILTAPLLLAIAGLTILISLIVNTGYYQFFMATQVHFAGRSQEMAVFMGAYQFWAAFAAMVVQLFLTVRVLKRLGVFLALLFFPLAVALGSVVALTTGGALLAIAMIKAADPALRQTLNQSALTVLYLPVPDGLRQRAKFFLDAIYALSFGLMGVAFVVAQRVTGWSYVAWCGPVLALIGVWLLLVRWVRPHYLRALADNLSGRRLASTTASAESMGP